MRDTEKGKERERLMALVLGVTALGVLMSPLPVPTKIIVGLSGTGLSVLQALEIKESRKRKEARSLDLAVELTERQTLIDAKDKELQANLMALEIAKAELASKQRLSETEAGLAKEELRAELAARKDNFLKDLAREEERRREEIEEAIARLEAEITQLEADKERRIAEIDREALLHKDELEARLEALEREAELERLERLNEAEAAIAQAKAAWEKDRDKQIKANAAELEDAEKALADQFIQARDQMVAELKELEEKLHVQAKQQYESWLVAHCSEMDERMREVEALKGTVQTLREQIAETRDIKLSGLDGTEWGDRSDKVLLWLKEQGIPCDYCNSDVLTDGTFVLNFMPWVCSRKTEVALNNSLVWMIKKFGLREMPLLESNGYARAWRLTMVSVHARSRDSERSAQLNLDRLGAFYSQRPPEVEDMRLGGTFRDLEPELREGVARRLNYEAQVQEMMLFRPQTLPKPTTQQITELELQTCKWFYFWRGLATDNEQPNITTREGLLWHVYGVREGRATNSYDQLMCESLGQRVKRILGMLRIEATQLSEIAESDEE
jgi:hypothetical protein